MSEKIKIERDDKEESCRGTRAEFNTSLLKSPIGDHSEDWVFELLRTKASVTCKLSPAVIDLLIVIVNDLKMIEARLDNIERGFPEIVPEEGTLAGPPSEKFERHRQAHETVMIQKRRAALSFKNWKAGIIPAILTAIVLQLINMYGPNIWTAIFNPTPAGIEAPANKTK